MDERFLNRIWRYPRIAARIFFNISTVQSDHFEAELLRVVSDQNGAHRENAREEKKAGSSLEGVHS